MTRQPLEPIPPTEIQAAQERIRGNAVRTPLVPFDVPGRAGRVWLKLESLQPTGGFELRGAGNVLALAAPEALARGVCTAGAGRAAVAVAWCARRLGVPCTVVIPAGLPPGAREPLEALGADLVERAFDEWWRTLVRHGCPGVAGLFVHPVADAAMIAGLGSVGLEILEDVPDVDAILVPSDGGALACGVACVARAARAGCGVWTVELDGAAPLAASLEAGAPVAAPARGGALDADRASAASGVLAEMWPLLRELVAGALVVSADDVERAVRELGQHGRAVAAGPGAAPVAAALAGTLGAPGNATNVVCVVSGGETDAGRLGELLRRRLPGT